MIVPKFENITNSTNLIDDEPPNSISMDSMYPALVQCFAIIICGYFAGLLKIISNHETKGLNTFVGTFALPSLIFLSLVNLDWKTVNWKFLLSILIAKAIVFVLVAVISLLAARPLNYGKAGLFAIFCTQSNDFAIGYPIVQALYDKIHPEYASYIYLLAPISLAILNPIAYIMMEITKMKERNSAVDNELSRSPVACPQAIGDQRRSRFFNAKVVMVFNTMRSIFLNPILSMTILGVIGGFVFPDGLPLIGQKVLKIFADSFSAPALFLLGLRMVGQGNRLQGSGFLIPGILILVKLLVLPLVTRQTVNIIHAGANFSDTTNLSTFAFFYGSFPSAPGVFVIATQYNLEVDLTAASMVACTFISGPLMFISAKMISLTSLHPNDYLNELNRFAFDISIGAVVACIWLLLLFGVTKKFKRMPHRITCCLVISQLIAVVGVIIWSTMESTGGWTMYLQFCLFCIGTYSSRLWSAILAIALLFLQCRSLCFVLKLWPILVGVSWGGSILLTSLLLIFDSSSITPPDKRNPNFQYGNAQAAISIFLLVMCFIVIVGCLVLHQRYKKRYEKYLSLSKDISTPDDSTGSSSPPPRNSHNIPANVNFSINTTRIRRFSSAADESEDAARATTNTTTTPNDGCNGTTNGDCCSSPTSPSRTNVVDIEDLTPRNRRPGSCNPAENEGLGGLCSSQFNCGGPSRESCQSLVQRYQENARDGLEPIEYDETIDEHQTLKHTVLLILLLCSMFVSLALSVWTLVMEGMSGIYVELSFLDAFLNFGQSIIVLAVFLTDSNEILSPVITWWRKIWYGANTMNLPTWDELNSETKHICEQFRTHHLDNCRRAIAKDRRWRIKIYKKVFYGNEFVSWLIEVGLAKERIEATHYAKRLVDGRILRHINHVYHFYDKNLLYTFCGRL